MSARVIKRAARFYQCTPEWLQGLDDTPPAPPQQPPPKPQREPKGEPVTPRGRPGTEPKGPRRAADELRAAS